MPFKSNEIESAFISQSSRIIPFQECREWSSLLCSGSFHLSEVIFTEQTGRLIINLHLRGQNLNPHLPSTSPHSLASARYYPWSAVEFISAEHLFQWLSLPLLSTAVRVKSRALSQDWNHLSHGLGLELISAEARWETQRFQQHLWHGEVVANGYWTTQMASTYYTAPACQQKSPSFYPFFPLLN